MKSKSSSKSMIQFQAVLCLMMIGCNSGDVVYRSSGMSSGGTGNPEIVPAPPSEPAEGDGESCVGASVIVSDEDIKVFPEEQTDQVITQLALASLDAEKDSSSLVCSIEDGDVLSEGKTRQFCMNGGITAIEKLLKIIKCTPHLEHVWHFIHEAKEELRLMLLKSGKSAECIARLLGIYASCLWHGRADAFPGVKARCIQRVLEAIPTTPGCQ